MSQQTNSKNQSNSLSVNDFIQHEKVVECLKKLNDEFGKNGKRPLIVSDTLDGEDHQYVNLVQKGGGVLGIALVGYTYILEEMGIRFLRMAGTSAGAINTGLMAVIGNKEDTKSTRVLDIICKLNFFNLVDGHPIARLLIKNFITHKDFNARVKKWIIGIVAALVILFAGDFIFLGLQHAIPKVAVLTILFFVLTGVLLLLIVILAAYLSTLFQRLKNSGYGINPGDYLYDWIKEQLAAYNVFTVSDLKAKASAKIPGLHLRTPHPESLNGLEGDVTFITSELVTENKIQFPEMCYLFREPGSIDTLQPAGFIRASMSIPIFFESYFIEDIPCTTAPIKEAWLKTFGETDPPTTARFVDGGILSNFPINIFYNPKVITPRLPSFGINLDDSKPEDHTKHAADWSLSGYLGRMFSTITIYYDKDFLVKNRIFEKGIGTISLYDFNWLNFFLKDEDKINMFVLGAQAATEFLLNFDWDDYKNNRASMHEQLSKGQSVADTAITP